MIDVGSVDLAQILSHLDIIPSSSDMNEWNESTRQELIWNPIRFIFQAPISLQPHRSLSTLSYTITNTYYNLLGSSVKEGVTYYHSQRNKKSYNKEILSASKVDEILKQEGGGTGDIALQGTLIATRNENDAIESLYLTCGNLEMKLDMGRVEEIFGSCEEFYSHNQRNSQRVYVLCHKEGSWSVRNWGMSIPQRADEEEIAWKKRVKMTLRDRNRFIVSQPVASDPNPLGLSDERGMFRVVNHLVAEIVMRLDRFYAYANEAPSIALNRKSQQAPILKPPRINKSNAARNDHISTAMSDTNKCYYLFQHSLVSYLVLIGVLNHLSCAVMSRKEEDEDAMAIDPESVIHDISAVREQARKVQQTYLTKRCPIR